jgi:4'-phosphopantetheinyl transferase
MTSDPEPWPAPPEQLVLHDEEVHVWVASLERPAASLAVWRELLAADERQRADRFHFQKDRDHFVAARGLLRIILGRYLRQSPEVIRFSYGPFGKPALAEVADTRTLHFNVSHTKGLALYAFAYQRALGVDIEYVRADLAGQEIAERFFSRQEVCALSALPAVVRTHAFFNCWTRKEAYIKARGEGLSLPLKQFDVTLTPGEPAALLSTRPDPQEASRWLLQELFPAQGYMAALAVEGRGWRLRQWQWPD